MNTLKKMSALVLAFMLVFSMCMVSVNAAETAEESSVVYVKPNSNWTQANARFAMYVFNSTTNQWVDMTDDDGDGYYEAEIPAGDWTNVIFCRMNPSNKANNWNTKWNQTSDLTIPEGMNCYLVKDGTWDKGGGEWVAYTPGEEPSTEPATEPSYKYTVAGDATLCGVAWTPDSEKNALTDEDGDGVYEITYKDVPAGTYSFKVTDGTWSNSWGVGTGNYSFTLNKAADVTIKFDETSKEITVDSAGLGSFVLEHMTVVGDAGLVGAKWDATAEEGIMTETEDGVWTITFKNVAAGTYEYKFVANDNYTYNWTVEGYFNSSLNSEIVVENDGADVTLTIDVSGYDFDAASGKVKASATVSGGTPVDPTDSTDPTEPTESQPVTLPADQDYYLFGTINGENYGCEEDWESLGDYKFVDGKLSVTFDTVSYVAVKTGDNANWYMTDGWAGVTKSVTLYNTSVLGEDANKLIVPAGEVEFTLVENADGTLTLSYESENEPEIPTEPATDPTAVTDPTEPTDPVTTDYYLFGTINGENYGCEDDWKNIGDYEFVDGKLSVTFDTVSYVAVKTGDNTGWFMTDGWQGITKSVTLYNTSKLGEDANKLIVPAGKVDFTLVENEDGTLTLSYESENEPEIPTEAPTTEEPTTEPATEATTAPATQPTTSAPSDVPTDGYYVYGSNIKLKLTACGTGKVSGTMALQKGTYTFKLDNYGTLLGYTKTFTDSTNGLTFNKKYSGSVTLNATGGTYTFQVNVDTNTLVVKYNSNLPNEYLIGDINTILSPVDGKPLAIGSTYLSEGTYKFKLSVGAKEFGYNKVVNDTTNGSSLSFNSKYSSYVTLNATGGTYTFTLNTDTKKLIVGYVPSKDESTDDVHVSGDVNLVLDDNGGESNIATGTVTLEEGTYSFKIFNYGVGFTAGAKIVDSGTKALKSSYKSNVTLVASGGTYEFSFNKTTGSLTVTKL